MALGRKGLTSGAIKWLTVCCFTKCAVCVLLGKHAAAVYFAAMQRNTQQHVTAGRRETCVVFTQVSPLKCKI
ncbi:unnamed protein product, partial [Staurois parvus]